MADADKRGAGKSDEDLDRELIELLNELRVALPGVQVLFAFMLILPFQNGFRALGDFARDVYFAGFLMTAIATAFFIAPTAYHRLRWREHDKERMLRTSNAQAIAGSVFLALAIVCTVYVITDVLHDARTAIVLALAVGLLYAWLWWGLPLTRRLHDR